MIAVLGGSSQLATTMKAVLSNPNLAYFDKSDIDITSIGSLTEFSKKYNPSIIINCAAYTNVNNAEKDIDNSYALNCNAVINLTEVFKPHDTHIIHISTDYVFDGNNSAPYQENYRTNPLNIYGKSKADGEQALIENYNSYTIIRTSWLFSSFKKNFLKTIFLKALVNEDLSVVSSEIGAPTDAAELAIAIEKVIYNLDLAKSKVFHFSGNNFVSWYQFAKDILDIGCDLGYLESSLNLKELSYESIRGAKRPKYSALNSQKFKKIFSFQHADYRYCIARCLKIIYENHLKKEG